MSGVGESRTFDDVEARAKRAAADKDPEALKAAAWDATEGALAAPSGQREDWAELAEGTLKNLREVLKQRRPGRGGLLLAEIRHELCKLTGPVDEWAEALDKPPPLPVRSDWTGEPPARKWLARNWLPAGRVAMLTGRGGAGKSRLALQVACAIASGRSEAVPSLDSIPTGDEKDPTFGGASRPVLYVGWEDEESEVHRRLEWLRGAGLRSVEGIGDRLHYLDAAGRGALWAPGREWGEPADWTSWAYELLAHAGAIDGLALLIVDPTAAAYGGNENDRAAVRAFISGLASQAALLDCAVLLIGHPPKASKGEGARYSGSTDWFAGVRALWTLRPAPVPGHPKPKSDETGVTNEGIALTLDKSSYGPAGDRAWLKLSTAGEEGRKGMAWRECTGHEALRSYAASRGLEVAEQADKAKNGKAKSKAKDLGLR